MAQFARPSADTVLGNYTDDVGGTTNIFQAIDESSANDLDYIESPTSPVNEVYATALSSITDPESSSTHVMRMRTSVDGEDALDFTQELREGYVDEVNQGTLIASQSRTAVSSAVWATSSYTLSGAEADSITDYSALFFRFIIGAAAGGGSGDTLASDGFESGDLTFANANFDWTATNTVASTEDSSIAVTSEHARTGTFSLRFTFGGSADGSDAWAEQRFAVTPNMTEVWMRWFQYFPDGTEGLGPEWQHRNSTGADNNKLLRFWDESYQNYHVKCGFSFHTGSTAGDAIVIAEYGIDDTGVGTQGLPSSGDVVTAATRGRWIEIVARCKIDDGGTNGILQMWFDGALIHDHQGIDMQPAGANNYFANGYLMGWANSGFDLTSNTYIDDVELADHDVWGVSA